MRGHVVNRSGRAVAAACLVAGGLALVGCGGGSDSTTSSTGTAGSRPLSQSEFTSQASAACREANDKIEALKAPPKNADLNTLASLAAQQITIANQTYSKLAGITPPSDLQQQYSQYLANGKASIGIAQQLESAAKSGDTGQVKKSAQKLAVNNKQGNSQAKELGLDECAKDVSPQG